jgi:DNA-binding protein HU-beta
VNKSQLIDELAERFDGNRKVAAHALESVVDVITKSVSAGEKVVITGFGAFERSVRKAGTARNPRTGDTVKTRDKYIAKFRPGSELKGVVSGARKARRRVSASLSVVPATAATAAESATRAAATGLRAAADAARRCSPSGEEDHSQEDERHQVCGQEDHGEEGDGQEDERSEEGDGQEGCDQEVDREEGPSEEGREEGTGEEGDRQEDERGEEDHSHEDHRQEDSGQEGDEEGDPVSAETRKHERDVRRLGRVDRRDDSSAGNRAAAITAIFTAVGRAPPLPSVISPAT